MGPGASRGRQQLRPTPSERQLRAASHPSRCAGQLLGAEAAVQWQGEHPFSVSVASAAAAATGAAPRSIAMDDGAKPLTWKSGRGKWLPGSAWVEPDGALVWEQDGQGKDAVDPIRVELDESIGIEEVQFGLRKHVFELVVENKQFQFAAVSDDDRAEWIRLVSKTAGIAPPVTEATKENAPKRLNTGGIAQKNKVLGLQNLLLGLPGGGSLGGGMLTQEEATAKLQAKLRGKVHVHDVSTSSCMVCNKRVDSAESVSLREEDAVVHSTCFFCTTCAETLTEDTYRVDPSTKALFCKEHFCLEDRVGESDVSAPPSTAPAPAVSTIPGGINHSAVMSRPTMKNRGRRRPTTLRPPRSGASAVAAKPSKPVVPADDHELGLELSIKKQVVVVVCKSATDKKKWSNALANAVELSRLRKELENAQRVDMFAAIQAQMDIESFEESHLTVMPPAVAHVCVKKKSSDAAKKWRLLPIELTAAQAFVVHSEKESKAKKPVATLELKRADFAVVDAKAKAPVVYLVKETSKRSLMSMKQKRSKAEQDAEEDDTRHAEAALKAADHTLEEVDEEETQDGASGLLDEEEQVEDEVARKPPRIPTASGKPPKIPMDARAAPPLSITVNTLGDGSRDIERKYDSDTSGMDSPSVMSSPSSAATASARKSKKKRGGMSFSAKRRNRKGSSSKSKANSSTKVAASPRSVPRSPIAAAFSFTSRRRKPKHTKSSSDASNSSHGSGSSNGSDDVSASVGREVLGPALSPNRLPEQHDFDDLVEPKAAVDDTFEMVNYSAASKDEPSSAPPPPVLTASTLGNATDDVTATNPTNNNLNVSLPIFQGPGSASATSSAMDSAACTPPPSSSFRIRRGHHRTQGSDEPCSPNCRLS